VLQHIQIDDLIDRPDSMSWLKERRLCFFRPPPFAIRLFLATAGRLFRAAALDEIKLNKFYNTFGPAHSPLTWPLDWNAISCDFFASPLQMMMMPMTRIGRV